MRVGDDDHLKKIMTRCVHFDGLFEHTHCKAGVEYDTITDRSVRPFRLPCLCGDSAVKCEKAQYKSEEEAKAEIEYTRLTHQRIGEVRGEDRRSDRGQARC